MQLGIRLHDVEAHPLRDRLRIVKDQGFSCAHVALSKVISEFPVENQALTPGLAMYLKRLFYDMGIDVAVLGCYLNLANPEQKQLKIITEKYIAHLRFAALLGSGVVGTETGCPNVEYRYEAACRGEEAYQTFITNLRPVIAVAEKFGVLFAIEPVRSHIIYDAKRARRLLDEIASPNLQIILDPVNLLGMDNYEQQTEVIQEAIELLGEDTAVVHVKDYNIDGDRLISCAAGLGRFEYEPLIRFIKQRKPYIHCTLEDTKPENAVEAREFIQAIWDRV